VPANPEAANQVLPRYTVLVAKLARQASYMVDENRIGTWNKFRISKLIAQAPPQPPRGTWPPVPEALLPAGLQGDDAWLALDRNGDGAIDAADAVFTSLRLWQDDNRDGVSKPAELRALPSLGVSRIGLNYRESRRRDRHGNGFRYRAKVDGRNGGDLGRWAYDVFLVSER